MSIIYLTAAKVVKKNDPKRRIMWAVYGETISGETQMPLFQTYVAKNEGVAKLRHLSNILASGQVQCGKRERITVYTGDFGIVWDANLLSNGCDTETYQQGLWNVIQYNANKCGIVMRQLIFKDKGLMTKLQKDELLSRIEEAGYEIEGR